MLKRALLLWPENDWGKRDPVLTALTRGAQEVRVARQQGTLLGQRLIEQHRIVGSLTLTLNAPESSILRRPRFRAAPERRLMVLAYVYCAELLVDRSLA